ncbi:hypothetical protein ACFLTE_09610 [Bacteroidota bacterium]
MKIERSISITSILVALLTINWIILLIILMKNSEPFFHSIEDALNFVKKPDIIFNLTYINVVLLTIADIILFALLYLFLKQKFPGLAMLGIIFIPIYGAYNLFCYISQISIVQQIQTIYNEPKYEEILNLVLGQLIQMWDKSTIAFINNYAYAILGISSIFFGIALIKINKMGKVAGGFLILSAIASILCIIGIISGNRILMNGSLIGGILFLCSLIPLAIMFWKEKSN